jgi:hypothetical protein
MVVRVQEVHAAIDVTGEMVLRYALNLDRLDVTRSIETVVEGADVNIINIEQDPAISLFRNSIQEIPFSHHRVREAHVTRYVFDEDRALQGFLHLSDSCRRPRNSFFCIR